VKLPVWQCSGCRSRQTIRSSSLFFSQTVAQLISESNREQTISLRVATSRKRESERHVSGGEVFARVFHEPSVFFFFFFFFLNLYKATLLCLSVVYMIVYAVYRCVRLCGKTEDARPKAEPTGNEDKHRATCRLTTRPGSLQGDEPGQAV
jgi:hypothetical protein